MKIQVTIRHKLFHNSHTEPVLATTTVTTDGDKIKIGDLKPTPDLADQREYVRQAIVPNNINQILRRRVPEFLNDTRFCIMWCEENCIETTMKDVTP